MLSSRYHLLGGFPLFQLLRAVQPNVRELKLRTVLLTMNMRVLETHIVATLRGALAGIALLEVVAGTQQATAPVCVTRELLPVVPDHIMVYRVPSMLRMNADRAGVLPVAVAQHTVKSSAAYGMM
ncbi:TPA: hypothetical protein DCL89_01390 [candidate division WWE3 bacterium]|uniref:Uncharacterized protein n=2 Tax=Katanobacteria TaxID=422282 RepID=A0A1F4W351_UNCKA|nr:MAG: hypothetical protein A2200_03490 [candidate division WWE3 bacterium RIFOXYA1_FULL_41_11]OGC63463.1 MAG: hypothetical protein A2399_03145 [candidate division WWE3 bacterium RIFOXYB1_FULL_42_27]OGC71449.1 MAG: hypothetical protein A2578_01530 [candidate division WWE3 bacterium RIFOXYD1_FULL_42_24]OGC74280.1 MAG: hypothetical protein A2425_00525 [candidate division WWE3 bacterium RIFOXYC1_FULL_42_17]HAI62861.1 hypothetical protein [candidate division WWE3 bacterium]